jgi:hypothetical protein
VLGWGCFKPWTFSSLSSSDTNLVKLAPHQTSILEILCVNKLNVVFRQEILLGLCSNQHCYNKKNLIEVVQIDQRVQLKQSLPCKLYISDKRMCQNMASEEIVVENKLNITSKVVKVFFCNKIVGRV